MTTNGNTKNGSSAIFTKIANATSHAAGKAITFGIAALIVLAWGISGPIFGFSDTWQLVINTGTTIVTFLMVFLIQNSQNRDGAAIQVKLDELIRNSEAHNRFVGIEHLTEEELEEIRAKCEQRAKADDSLVREKVVSIDQAARKAAERTTAS
jgi:low affinity Fe/Cu permease